MSPILMLIADTSVTFTATVVIAGILIVVGILLLLILIFYLFGIIVPKIEKASKSRAQKKAIKKAEKKARKSAVKAEAVEVISGVDGPTAVFKAPAPVTPAPVVEAGISNEVVAAITAAIVASEGPTAVVRSVKRKNVGGRNPWAQAANVDNTRPF